MKSNPSVHTFISDHKVQSYGLMLLISIVYLINFGANDIWTPNESFYAEAVREMFESGNFVDIKYNYEPRYNKPPLTYWLMALSAGIFGMSEFALRLPIILLSLGSIWLTYLLGKQLFDKESGLLAMMMMAVSVQLLAVKQYASPEIPLTFFFTLSLYYFIKGYQKKSAPYIYLFYVALGLAVLVKGYPYIVVIGGIVVFYMLLNHSFKLKLIWKDILFLKPWIGILLVLTIGLSWIFYMYWQDGQEFWTVYKRETFDRAFTRDERSMRWSFYFGAMAWTIAPYSIAFYYAFIKWLTHWKKAKVVLFPLSWLLVMLVIFTFSKGKIPTYFIQAHPAMILMTIPLLNELRPQTKLWLSIWQATLIIPTVLLGIGIIGLIYSLKLPFVLYALAPTGIFCLYYWYKIRKVFWLVFSPFISMIILIFCFALFLPKIEQVRPYDEIGAVIEENIAKEVPLMIEGTLIHNMPYYAERRVIRDAQLDEIINSKGKTLVLIKAEKASQLQNFDLLWEGMIYDFPSESQFAKFIQASVKALAGDFSKFADYQLLYRELKKE